MPSITDRRPKIPAQKSSQNSHTHLHLQDPHLYPGSTPSSLLPRDNFITYSHLTNSKSSNPNPVTNTRRTAPIIRPDPTPQQTQPPPSPPSDAALFWSFVSRQIKKQKTKSRAKKATATTTTTTSPTPHPIPIIYPSPTSTRPPRSSPQQKPQQQQPYSLFRAHRDQQKEKKTRAKKALISAPLKGGVTVVRTDSGHEYSFPEPRAESGAVRIVRSGWRTGTRRGRGVVMPRANSKVVGAGLREVEKRSMRRGVPSEGGVLGLGIELGDVASEGERADGKGDRVTRWGDFLGKSSGEREGERRAKADAPAANAPKTGREAYGGRDERCRICHEMPRMGTKESRSSGVCGRCESEYSSPYTPHTRLLASPNSATTIAPTPHLKDSRLYSKPSPHPSATSSSSAAHLSVHPDTLFADFNSDGSDHHHHLKYQLSPFDFEADSYASRTPVSTSALSPNPSANATATDPRTPTTKRRGAVSAASPFTQRQGLSQSQSRSGHVALPTAPPIPQDGEYTSRRYGAGRKGKDEKRRSSFYDFWEDVLAGSRTSLAGRRGYAV